MPFKIQVTLGAECKGGYFLFRIPIVFEKNLELVDYGAFQKMGEKVVVREADCIPA